MTCHLKRIFVISFSFFALFFTIFPAFSAELVPDSAWCNVIQYPTRSGLDLSSHLLYVTSPRTGKIVALDEAGHVMTEITAVAHPMAIATDGAGFLYVTDDHAVRKITTSGVPVLLVGGSETAFANPHDVVVAPNGQIFVADGDSIKVFSAAGVRVRAFGGHGYFAGQLQVPVAMVYDGTANELFVADQNNYRINTYAANGTFIRTWGRIGTGDYAPGKFLREWGIDHDAQGRLWVLDPILSTVQLFDYTGNFLFQCLVNDPRARSCTDITVDGDRLYLLSQSQHCVLVFRINENSTPLQFNLVTRAVPAGIALYWNPARDMLRYHVYRLKPHGTRMDTTALGTTTDTFYVDSRALGQCASCSYVVTVDQSIAPCGESFGSGVGGSVLDSNNISRSHNSPHTVTYGVDCSSCHFTNLVTVPYPTGEWWNSDQICKSCHVETGMATAEQNHFAATDTMYCTTCHSPHFQQPQYPHKFIRDVVTTPHNGDKALAFNSATDFVHGAPAYDGICEICHTLTAHYRNNASGDHSHNTGTNCLDCHKHISGFKPTGGSCNSCHEAVPRTGAHRFHVGDTTTVAYGDLRITKDFADPSSVYIFGCGNCHPADMSHHRDGHVDVELYNPNVASTSLKAKNPASATYTPGSQVLTDERGINYTNGTCSNIYCHSSGQSAALRTYVNHEWGRTTDYGCGDCHGEPPSYPSTSVGGDGANSHYQPGAYWGDDMGHVLGIHWGHDSTTVANNTATELNCNICHYGTTTSDQNVGLAQGQGRCTVCHTPGTLPPMGNRGVITNKAKHVSGTADVAFSPLPFRSSYNNASEAAANGWTRYPNYAETNFLTSAYNPQTKTCTNIACHLVQEQHMPLQWGSDPTAGWGCACHSYSWPGPSARRHTGNSRMDNTNSCVTCHPKNSFHKATPRANSDQR